MQASVQSAHTVQWSCTEVAVSLEKEYLAMAESGHAPSAVSSEKDVETRPVRACVLVFRLLLAQALTSLHLKLIFQISK